MAESVTLSGLVAWRARSRLKKAFTVAELYREYPSYSGAKGRVYPQIHAVIDRPASRDYVFTLPNGLDPRELVRKEYVFKQVLGARLRLDGEIKRFVLRVYKRSMPAQLAYMHAFTAAETYGKTLPILVGVDATGEVITYDMAQYPHLLIAGETGSGKSTQLRSILTTLVRKSSPAQLRLVLADLKRSEFHVFRRVAHVDSLSVKVAQLKRVMTGLRAELDRRGDLLDAAEMTHVADLPANKRPPNIVVCVDEVALLKREKAIMGAIEDISAIGRALGVYLILSMQRPDRDVLDGKLKNNLTVRMAFRHSDGINSRITIGSQDAKDINIGERGRFYFKHEELTLLQAPHLTPTQAREYMKPYIVAEEKNAEESKDPGIQFDVLNERGGADG